MSKKILSLVLAVVMLFSVCAVFANAEVADGKRLGIKIVSDAKIGDPAGTIVNVKVYYTVPDESQEYYLQNGPIAVAWNSNSYDPNVTDPTANSITACRTWGSSYVDVFKETAAVTQAANVSSGIISTHYANVTDSYNWDKGCRVVLTMNGTNGYNSNTGFPIDPACEVFTMSFVAKKTIEATDVIGIPYGAYNGANFMINERIEGDVGAYPYTADELDFSLTAAVPTKHDVYKLSAPLKHANGDNTYTVAAFFAFKNIAPDFVTKEEDPNKAGYSKNIASIGVTVTGTNADGESLTITPEHIQYVYDLGSGEYGFRVIMKSVGADAKIEIKPSVVTNDSQTYSAETISFDVSTVEEV